MKRLLPLLFALSCALACESEPRTIESCETDIADDAPAFYARFFRCVTVTKQADSVVITTRALPPHQSYYYGQLSPNYADFDDRGGENQANPNTLQERALSLTVPDEPVAAGVSVNGNVDATADTSEDELPMGAVGVALDSVPLFNSLAAPGDDIEDERFTFDDYNAHPAPDGTYHYHTASKGPLEVLLANGDVTTATPGEAEVELYGVLCDGTVVLGCRELDGGAIDGATLDDQGGHEGDLVDKDGTTHFVGRYHTHVCDTDGYRYTPEIQFYASCER